MKLMFDGNVAYCRFCGNGVSSKHGVFQPRYKVGETVYIKEPFLFGKRGIIYKYDKMIYQNVKGVWNNPRTMAANQARHFIEITGLRCERVQDISD